MTRLRFLAFCAALAIRAAPDPFEAKRREMVTGQIAGRGVRDQRVLSAMRKVPRHAFVPEAVRRYAYEDQPLPIGHRQTISQPYIVAIMTELLAAGKGDTVLEIGTGSGYQAAVLAELVRHVYTIEIVPELAKSASAALGQLGYQNVTVRQGDGYKGWPEKAPFDRIILTAAPPEIPQALIDQLRPGGKLVAPVGGSSWSQELVVLNKDASGKLARKTIFPVVFVPMVRP